LQDVPHRLDRTFQAFFRRVTAGEHPGYPRLQGTDRYNSFTYPQMGQHGGHGGAVVDGGVLSLSKLGRLRLRLHRPLHGTPKTVTISREADGCYACISCAQVSIVPLPATGCETGIDVGLKVLLITADGEPVDNPRHSRRAERALRKAQRRVARRTQGSRRRRKAVALLKRTQQQVQRQRRDFHTRPRWTCCASTTSSTWRICRSAIWSATTTWPSASVMLAGQRSVPSLKPRQHASGVR
jgi:putative transposase